jgi:hypothetical protein
MQRCKVCKVPLSGFLSAISKLFFKVRPSQQDSEVCNKCADRPLAEPPKVEPSGKKYKCEICQRMIDEEKSLEHVKAEEYLIELIKKDHPQWCDKSEACKECIQYYRKLVNEAEI